MSVKRSIIDVLIVEDSQVVRQHLKHILEADPHIKVIGMVENGEDAVRFVNGKRPDVITMDINLPEMNGLAATRKIMETNPVPIVIVSASYSPRDAVKTFAAMEAGAVAVVDKPGGLNHGLYEIAARDLVHTVRLMSEVKVIKRWPKARTTPEKRKLKDVVFEQMPGKARIIAIGASTGGPPVLQKVLSGIKDEYPVSVLVVQHIARGFIGGLVEWLRRSISMPIHIATDGETVLPGHIYFAPDNFHMGIGKGRVILLSKSPPENGTRPSVSYLFRSAVNIVGKDMVGVLLTGMGKDGAEELLLMKEMGALTVAQDRDSSVVYGMPGEAARLGAASYILSPDEIAGLLGKITKKEVREGHG